MTDHDAQDRADADRVAGMIDRLEFGSTFTLDGELYSEVQTTDDMAPECFHVDAPAPADIETWAGWSSALVGFSGQYGYTGGVMHASEYVGEGIARHLIESYAPGTVFALVSVEVLDHDEDGLCLDDDGECVGGHEPAGWTILARNAHQISDTAMLPR